MRPTESDSPQAFPSDIDVDAVLREFAGDHRAAIAALLHDVAALAADFGLSVSRGYVRRGTAFFSKGAASDPRPT